MMQSSIYLASINLYDGSQMYVERIGYVVKKLGRIYRMQRIQNYVAPSSIWNIWP